MTAKDPKRYVDGRIVGGCSLHAQHKPELCTPESCQKETARCVDCCEYAGEDQDIVECLRCGKQWRTPCTFDEEYS